MIHASHLSYSHLSPVLVHRNRQWVPVNFGQRLSILVGDPLTFDDILAEYRAGGMSRRCVQCLVSAHQHPFTTNIRRPSHREMHIKVANRIGDALAKLRVRCSCVVVIVGGGSVVWYRAGGLGFGCVNSAICSFGFACRETLMRVDDATG